MGMLSHGCMGGFMVLFPALARFNTRTADVLTSGNSTVPYDSDKMLKMMKLVQNARGVRVRCRENDMLTSWLRG
jgi:hypothetical protein